MGQLKNAQTTFVDSPKEADILIINTCGFIAPSKKESIDAILEAEQIKIENSTKKVVVCGCLSQRYKQELKKEMPVIDAFFGTEDYDNILQFLFTSPKKSPKFLYEKRILTTPVHYAYLKIAEGCNHKCSFCAIPLMRGKYFSRPMQQIIEETKMLAQNGVRELILISQDSTFYGIDLYGSKKIVELLSQLECIDGINWIRLHYLYPTTVKPELIDYMAESSKVVPYLDMPIQHISDRMLALMKRGGKSKQIRNIFKDARKKIPDVTLRTTLIVGHPDELEEDFQELKNYILEIQFDRLGVFKYSHEENTTAFNMNDSIPADIKDKRYNEIMEIQRRISIEKNKEKIGKTFQVLIDEINYENSYAMGRTKADSPEIDNEVIIENINTAVNPGTFREVYIKDAIEYDLYGMIED